MLPLPQGIPQPLQLRQAVAPPLLQGTGGKKVGIDAGCSIATKCMLMSSVILMRLAQVKGKACLDGVCRRRVEGGWQGAAPLPGQLANVAARGGRLFTATNRATQALLRLAAGRPAGATRAHIPAAHHAGRQPLLLIAHNDLRRQKSPP